MSASFSWTIFRNNSISLRICLLLLDVRCWLVLDAFPTLLMVSIDGLLLRVVAGWLCGRVLPAERRPPPDKDEAILAICRHEKRSLH